MLLQGCFVPYNKSLYKKRFNIISFAENTDWTPGDPWRIPIDLAQAMIEVHLTTSLATNDYAGEIFFRRINEGDELFIDTVTDGLGDILDGDLVDEANYSLHGVMGTLNFHTNQEGNAAQFNKKFILEDARQGDNIVWDIRQTGDQATLTGTFDLKFTLAGFITRQAWCECGDFIDMGGMIDLNSPEHQGVVQ